MFLSPKILSISKEQKIESRYVLLLCLGQFYLTKTKKIIVENYEHASICIHFNLKKEISWSKKFAFIFFYEHIYFRNE
jgi:hypothetical protein